MPKIQRYTNEYLLDSLIRFHRENGRAPSTRDFTNCKSNCKCPIPNYQNYRKQFGSWNNALKKVGLDIDSRVLKGCLNTNQEKGRFAEIIIRNAFDNKGIDISGKDPHNYYDGICPNGHLYDVKSAALGFGGIWTFGTENNDKDDNKEAIQWFYFIAFNADYTAILYVWKVPGELVEHKNFYIGINRLNDRKFNIENMKEYDVTDKFKKILNIE